MNIEFECKIIRTGAMLVLFISLLTYNVIYQLIWVIAITNYIYPGFSFAVSVVYGVCQLIAIFF